MIYLTRRKVIIGAVGVSAPLSAYADQGAEAFLDAFWQLGEWHQIDFANLSGPEVKAALRRWSSSKSQRTIIGFSRPGTEALFQMGASDHRSTKRVMRDMNKLSDISSRRNRLAEERSDKQGDLKKSDDKLAKAKADGKKLRTTMLTEEVRGLNQYIAGVNYWYRNPREGLLGS